MTDGAEALALDLRMFSRIGPQADSMTVLGRVGAERLMLHGDMLFQHGTGVPIRLGLIRPEQGCYGECPKRHARCEAALVP